MRGLASWVVCGCVGVAACGPTADVPLAAQREAVLASSADTTTAAVMLLDLRFDNGDAAICSGVLITPRVLLTAAHCVDPAMHAGATAVTVKATSKADLSGLKPSDFTVVTTISRHPSWNHNDTASAYDLAVLLLASAQAATPIPLLRALPGGFVGRTIRLVGYGRTTASTDDSGTRRSASVTVGSVASRTFAFGSAGSTGICNGDSGGGALYVDTDGVEKVAGTHSLTTSTSCGSGSDMRVDQNLDLIDAFITANDPATCAADGRCATGCASPDPDCRCVSDGRCDTGCTPIDPDCLCVADGTCETSCPKGRTDPDCGCQADGACVASCASDPDCADCAGNGVCSAATCPTADPDCLLDGQVCQQASQCLGHRCIADARGFSFCTRDCANTAVCQLDFVCRDSLCQEPTPTPLTPVKGGCASVPGWLAPALGLSVLALRRRRV